MKRLFFCLFFLPSCRGRISVSFIHDGGCAPGKIIPRNLLLPFPLRNGRLEALTFSPRWKRAFVSYPKNRRARFFFELTFWTTVREVRLSFEQWRWALLLPPAHRQSIGPFSGVLGFCFRVVGKFHLFGADGQKNFPPCGQVKRLPAPFSKTLCAVFYGFVCSEICCTISSPLSLWGRRWRRLFSLQ